MHILLCLQVFHNIGRTSWSVWWTHECWSISRRRTLRIHLKVLDGEHVRSLQFGILCLKRTGYSRGELENRWARLDALFAAQAASARASADANGAGDTLFAVREAYADLLYWSNEHLVAWSRAAGLAEFAAHLHETGVHGAVLALDDTFTAAQMALAMQIPRNATSARERLESELTMLIETGRQPHSMQSSTISAD